jgi:hypothetical protein
MHFDITCMDLSGTFTKDMKHPLTSIVQMSMEHIVWSCTALLQGWTSLTLVLI